MTDRKWFGRRAFYGVLLVVLVVLAVPVSQAIARTARVSATFEKNVDPDNCANFPTGHSSSGTVSFDRVGDTLSVAVHSRHAYSTGNAFAYLYDADGCTYFEYIGKYKIVDGSGDKNADIDVSGRGPYFYVCIGYYKGSDFLYDCSAPVRP
jgi:hypothetical protein